MNGGILILFDIIFTLTLLIILLIKIAIKTETLRTF